MWGTSGLDMPRDEARVGPTVIYLLYNSQGKEATRTPCAAAWGRKHFERDDWVTVKHRPTLKNC